MRKLIFTLVVFTVILTGCGNKMQLKLETEKIVLRDLGYYTLTATYFGPDNPQILIDDILRDIVLKNGKVFQYTGFLSNPEQETITVKLKSGNQERVVDFEVDSSEFKETSKRILIEAITKTLNDHADDTGYYYFDDEHNSFVYVVTKSTFKEFVGQALLGLHRSKWDEFVSVVKTVSIQIAEKDPSFSLSVRNPSDAMENILLIKNGEVIDDLITNSGGF